MEIVMYMVYSFKLINLYSKLVANMLKINNTTHIKSNP